VIMDEYIKNAANYHEEEEGIGFIDLWFVILKRYKVFLFILIVLITLSGLKVYHNIRNQVPIYISKTMIYLGPVFFNVKSSSGDIIQKIYDAESEVILLRSSMVAERAAKILKEKYGYEENIERLLRMVRKALDRGMDVSDLDIFDKRQDVSGIVIGDRNRLSQHPNTIIISAYSENPKFAFDVISAVLEGYVQVRTESERNFFRDTYKTFNQQLDSAYQSLLVAENKLSEYIIENQDIINTMEELGLTQHKEQDVISTAINETYVGIKKDLLEKKEFLRKVKVAEEADILAAFTMLQKQGGYVFRPELENMLLEKEETLANLLQINEEAHPAVRQAVGEIGSVRNSIMREISRATDDIKDDIALLEKKEIMLADLIEKDLYQKAIQYSMMKSDIATKRRAYNNLGEELHNISMTEKMTRYTDLKVLEPHAMPNESHKNLPKMLIIMSIFFSFAASIISVYLLEKFDRTIKDIKDLERITDKPVITIIPVHRL
jgi:uncharacterized protein involved in exopolysaccharide biosynthesis